MKLQISKSCTCWTRSCAPKLQELKIAIARLGTWVLWVFSVCSPSEIWVFSDELSCLEKLWLPHFSAQSPRNVLVESLKQLSTVGNPNNWAKLYRLSQQTFSVQSMRNFLVHPNLLVKSLRKKFLLLITEQNLITCPSFFVFTHFYAQAIWTFISFYLQFSLAAWEVLKVQCSGLCGFTQWQKYIRGGRLYF